MAEFFTGLSKILTIVGWFFFGFGIANRIRLRKKKITPTKRQLWQWWFLMVGAWVLGGICLLIGNHMATNYAQAENTAPAYKTLADLDAAMSEPSSNDADQCVGHWTDAYRKEVGEDAVVTQDQLDEWNSWCKERKHAPGF
ncbi:hypothetical protein ACFWZ1_09650 [Frateuria sp. GZRe14]|uniref:hypothetical protein n=1 Tax=Frateuria sp. GZRe14 TaxID=3351534 RepID=UPI003EDBA3B2